MGTENWIGLMERIYSLEGDDLLWLNGILNGISRDGVGEGIAAYSFALRPSGVAVEDVAVCGGPTLHTQIDELVRNSSPESMDLVFRSGQVVATLSEYLWAKDPTHAAMFRKVTDGPPDVLGIVAHSGDGHGVVLNLPLVTPRRSTVGERRGWMRGAAHIGSALRLRRLVNRLASFEGDMIEAIFDGEGKLHDARNDAAGQEARQILRNAVSNIDKARSARSQSDNENALENWEALVHGRWSLIDRFDTDNRRFVVAIRNDPRFSDPRGLSLQERQVAEYIGLGRSTKEISYILGVPSASAENCARRAQTKLGLRSRVELATFFSPQGTRARLAEITFDDDVFLVGESPLLGNRMIEDLTDAEKSVLGLIIAGSSNSDIARRRATSARTVANQIQAIFRKCGARSRCELIARIAG